jgi:CheY-like chemotaxis protein
MSPSFPILFVGNVQRAEFRRAAEWLQNRGAQMTPDIAAALNVLEDPNFSPALIVLAQLGSQTFFAGQIEALRRTAPLARIVRLLDPWLEGESRSGQPLPATLRSPWEQWPACLQRLTSHALSESDSSKSTSDHFSLESPCSLPVTANEDDRQLASIGDDTLAENFLNRIEYPAQHGSPIPLIAVCARHRDTAQSLCEICTTRGWKSLWLRTLPAETPLSVDAVIFDLAYGTSQETEMLSTMKALVGAAPLIALWGFPRPEDLSRLHAAGVAAVVSKPLLADALLWQIQQLLPSKFQFENR